VKRMQALRRRHAVTGDLVQVAPESVKLMEGRQVAVNEEDLPDEIEAKVLIVIDLHEAKDLDAAGDPQVHLNEVVLLIES
jgi:hypothetical protein